MAVYSLTINGVEREVLVDGYDIHASLDGPDTMAGGFFSDDASFVPVLDDEFIFTVDGVRHFAGYVMSTRLRGADGPGGDGGDEVVTEITAQDYSSLTRHAYVTVTIAAGQNVKQALTAILAAATSMPLITLSGSQANGPTLTQDLVFDNETVAQAILRVIQWANSLNAPTFGWYSRINYNGVLEAFAPGSVPAPFDLIEGVGTEVGDVQVTDARSEDYANHVIVDGGSLILTGHTDNFVADGITDTFPLTLIPLVWRLVFVNNLLWETIGTSPALWTIDPVAKTITRVAGIPSVGTPIAITYDGQLNIIGNASVGSAAASPPFDVVTKRVQVSGLTSIAEADAEAESLVASLSASNKLALYPTDRTGLAPGQTQTLTVPKRFLTGSWLLRDVITKYHGGEGTDGLRYEVTASESGIVKGTFKETYRNWDEVGGDQNAAMSVGPSSPIGAAGNDTEVQYNDKGIFGADPAFTFDEVDKVVTVNAAAGTVVARGTDTGPTYGPEDSEAIFTVLQKNENVVAVAIGNSVAGAAKAITIYVTNAGQVYVQHNGGSGNGLAIYETGGKIELDGVQGLELRPGSIAANAFADLDGLNGIDGLALASTLITGTTYTVDSLVTTNPITVFICDPSGSLTFNLPSLTSFSVNPQTGLYRVLCVRNDSSAQTVTIDPNGSDTINGAATLVLQPGQVVWIAARTGTGAGWKLLTSPAAGAHASTHQSGGSDPIKLDDLAAPDDNTDLNASTTKHGLLPKLSGNSNEFLNGLGAFADPGTGSGSGNVTDTTAFGSEPAGSPGPNAGDLVLYNNSFYLSRYTGAIWEPWGPIFQCTAPVSGDFSWVNQGGASVDTTNGGIYLTAPSGAGNNLRVRVKTAPSTPYTITAMILPLIPGLDFANAGLCFRESGTGELVTFSLVHATNFVLAVDKYDSATVYNATYTTLRASLPSTLFLRIADNGTNRICSWSTDGQHWIVIHTIGRTDFLTADQVGFFAQANNATWPSGMTLLSWKQA